MAIRLNEILICLLFCLCVACSSNKSEEAKKLKTVTAEMQPSVNTLYFSGTVAPLQIYTVDTPVEGVIQQKYFEYGTEIRKGQLLILLRSAQLAEDYQTSLAAYLKAKKDYLNNLNELRGTEYLKKLGIISANEYVNAKSTNYDLEMAYNAASRKLQVVLNKMGIPFSNVMQLYIENVAAVHAALARPADILKITAPAAGIALVPGKSGSGGGGEEGGTLTVGSQVKANQALLGIGDRSGISIVIKVGEVNVNDIKEGQEATITGDAFPDITLRGRVKDVVEQGTSEGGGGGAPTFPVHVVVPQLTSEQRKTVQIGMSAKVALQIKSKPAIRVPISAVVTENGQTIVKVLDPKTKKATDVPVMTGVTTVDSVEIVQGLKPGDKVIVNPTSD